MAKPIKVKVHELAKELNTSSKKLIERLAEINIIKTNMSSLDESEIEALYKHIGLRHIDNDNKEKKAASTTPDKKTKGGAASAASRSAKVPLTKKDTTRKNAPHIIKTTVINHETEKESQSRRGSYVRNDRSDTTGLRLGYVRDTSGLEMNVGKKKTKSGKDSKSAFKSTRKKDSKAVKIKKETAAPAAAAVPETTVVPPVLASEAAQAAASVQATQAAAAEFPAAGVSSEIIENQVPVTEKTVATETTSSCAAALIQKTETPAQADITDDLVAAITSATNEAAVNDLTAVADNKAESVDIDKKEDALKDSDKGLEDSATEGKAEVVGGQAQPMVTEYTEAIEEKEEKSALSQETAAETPEISTIAGVETAKKSSENISAETAEAVNIELKKSDSGKVSPISDSVEKDEVKDSYNMNKQDKKIERKKRSKEEQPAQNKDGRQPFREDKKQRGDKTPKNNATEMTFTPLIDDSGSTKNEEKRAFSKDRKKEKGKKEREKDIPRYSPIPEKRTPIVKHDKLAITEKKGINEVLDENFIMEAFYSDERGKLKKSSRSKKRSKNAEKFVEPPKPVVQTVKISDRVVVKELAEALKKTSAEVIKKLLDMGLLVTVNEEIDYDTAAIIADEFGIQAQKMEELNEEDILFDEDDDPNDPEAVSRPPVVVVMGHVDHGKTSLLDAIRNTSVINTEAGGITQHIGAYMVNISGRDITFLDTPGHEAFTSMRARGAQVTDIAILVVAADDGIMPQTIEAINHAKAANVSIIVAINKIDKPSADPDRIKQQMTEYGLLSEEWGGDTIYVNVSAKHGTNIDQLLEMVLLVADMLELKANPNKQAKGTIIEARLDKGRGVVATVLVQRGTLRIGDSIVTGTTVGHIRAMTNEKGVSIKEAGPSTPVEILGLPEVPEAGEDFHAIKDEKIAKQLAEKRKLKQREQILAPSAKVSLDDLFNQINEGKVKELNIIIKADVQGSVEALKQALVKLSNENVRINIVHDGVGAVTESDVTLASVSNAIILGFNVRPGPNANDMAKDEGVDIRTYRVIYDAIEDIESAMTGLLDPEYREVVTGHVEIRQTFKVSGLGTVGGGHVTDGRITRNSGIRLLRNGIIVHEGKLSSLKRFKDDVREVQSGYDCGLMIEKYNDIKEGDVIEAFVNEKVEQH